MIAFARKLRRLKLPRSFERESFLFQRDKLNNDLWLRVSSHRHYYNPESNLLFRRRHHNFDQHVSMSTSTALSTSSSSDVDDENESAGIGSSDMDEGAFDQLYCFTGDGETSEDDLSYLRVKLYKIEENEEVGEYLEKLYEAASIQQVFDVIEDYEKEHGYVDIRLASQALITVWDLQKLIFKISMNFDPERDYFDKPDFIEKVSSHPILLQKIVKTVMDNCKDMEDEPLTATLFCLKRMHHSMRSPECEKFVEECLSRKDTLALASLSRLFVCLRDESLYGNNISAKFQPLLWKYVETMSSDLDVRLVAISLKSTLRVASDAMIIKFTQRIQELQQSFENFESVTLCKIFLVLLVFRNGNYPLAKPMFDAVGESLIPRVPTLHLMDLLSLQRFLEAGINQPYELVEVLVQRMKRIVQKAVSTTSSPRLDLISSISPYLRSVEQRRQIAIMLKEYLDNQFFELASGILFPILRWSRTSDPKVYDLFWRQAQDMITAREEAGNLDRRLLKMGRDYINFCYGLNFSYRNKSFEFAMKRYLYSLIENYREGRQPSIITPGDFSKAFCFLIGVANTQDPIFNNIEVFKILNDFAPQFRGQDLTYLSRGLESVVNHLFNVKQPPPKYYNRVIDVCSILEEQCARLLQDKEVADSLGDLMSIHRVSLVTRKIKGDTPIVQQSLQLALDCDLNDTRAVKDISQALMIGGNNYPEATRNMFQTLWKFKDKPIYPEVIEKFLCATFTTGWELEKEEEHEVIDFCSKSLNQDWDKISFPGLLQASTALCYYRRLPKELIQKIFSVDFLDEVDAELKYLHHGHHYPMKLRQAMMELNRAVSIDMPDLNLPWFHEKFCEQMLASNPPQDTYLHREVHYSLANIVGDALSVQSNVLSPYYYKLDFLIEFDEKRRPIKKRRRESPRFFEKFREPAPPLAPQEVSRKVAVLILHPTLFTRNVRKLKGLCKLRRRHLEILGYDVIEIDPRHWNSMFMSENSMRHHFLETKLYANARATG